MALGWFKNYLTPRDMTVKIEKSYSKGKEITFSVPQGSCSGANLFNMHSGTIREVVDPCLNLLAYADDLAIIKELNPNQSTEEKHVIDRFTENLNKIKEWMNSVRLRMNSSKSEFIIFGNRAQENKCVSDGLRIEGEMVHRSHIVKYLGAWLDSNLTLKTHVKKTCVSAMLNLQRIKNIWKFLTRDSCMKLVVSLCLPHLDYSNSISYRVPNSTIQQMQNIQSYGAKLVLGRSKYDSNKEALAELHWLPVKSRIKFNILMLVF